MTIELTQKQFREVIKDFCWNSEQSDRVKMAEFFIKEASTNYPRKIGHLALFCIKKFSRDFDADLDNPELFEIVKIINKLK
jgi:hypothetical protein